MHKTFPKLVLVFWIFIIGYLQKANSQTTLSAGDLAIIAVNTTNTDQFAFVLLKDISTGTIINFTDNGFTSATAGRTSEGYLTYTAPGNVCAGTVITWTNNMTIAGTGWNSNNPSGFGLNNSGDQLFAFQGTADDSHWASQSGITLIYGIDVGNSGGWVTSGNGSATTTWNPTALAGIASVTTASTKSNAYFANGSSSISTFSRTDTKVNLLTLFTDNSKYFNTNSDLSNPTYIIIVSSVSVNSPSICGSGSAILTASGASTYKWAPNTNLSATNGTSVTASPTSNITYTVTGTSTVGCTVNATSIVTVTSNPNVTVNTPPAYCNGSSASLTANNATTYTWAPNTNLTSTIGASVTASPTTTTTYTVTGTGTGGCTANATSVVTVTPAPNVTVNTPGSFL